MQADVTSDFIAPICFFLVQLKRTNPTFDNYFRGVDTKFFTLSLTSQNIRPLCQRWEKINAETKK